MPQVVSVKFPFASKALWFDPAGLSVQEADYAIVHTERGTEIGLVTSAVFDVSEAELAAPLKPVLRIADERDLAHADELAKAGEDAMGQFRQLIEKNELDMKPIGVEFLFGGERAIFYFSAEERVDFRQLVRDLADAFHAHVDMRQIGVRDETRLMGGFATCGQELCCARFGHQFDPVSIRMAKEQDLPLNSAKISGVCGRLMCCLRYEFEAYKDFKSRAPKKKTLIDTPLGKARIQEYDTPREQLVLRLESGRVFKVSLSDMSCSNECTKRAQDAGCACRPDCVTRDIMERIESPEIKLALAELDRQHGIDVRDGLDEADRISIAREDECLRPARLRAKTDAQDEQIESPNTPSARQRSPRAPARRRTAQKAPTQGIVADTTERSPKRRHRAPASSEAVTPERERTDPRPARRHRRTQTAEKPEVPSVARQVAKGDIQVKRRHPGDGGGSAAHSNAASSTSSSSRRRHHRSRRSGNSGNEST